MAPSSSSSVPSVYDTHCAGDGLLPSTPRWSRFYCQLRRFVEELPRDYPLPPQVDLVGKNVIITGANSGIGAECAEVCARWGANVILACRDPPPHEPHPEAVIDGIVERNPGVRKERLEWWSIDLGSFESIRNFAKRWVDSGRACDYLFNNAGSAFGNLLKTEDGFELTHQINFLSHCLITLLLLPTMKKAEAPRIIMTSSRFHFGGRLDFSNMDYEKKDNRGIGGVDAYCDTKLFLYMWTRELQKRLTQTDDYKHVVAHAIHPGYVSTNIWNQPHIRALPWFLRNTLDAITQYYGVSPYQGAQAMLHAAFRAERGVRLAAVRSGSLAKGDSLKVGGRFYLRTSEDPGRPEAHDELATARVWQRVLDDVDAKRWSLAADLPGHPKHLA